MTCDMRVNTLQDRAAHKREGEDVSLHIDSDYQTVTATFRPKHTDHLRPGVAEWIGKTLEWRSLWVIEDGQHEGEWAMAPMVRSPCPPFAWAPLSDLAQP
jgi:hypothetical protein